MPIVREPLQIHHTGFLGQFLWGLSQFIPRLKSGAFLGRTCKRKPEFRYEVSCPPHLIMRTTTMPDQYVQVLKPETYGDLETCGTAEGPAEPTKEGDMSMDLGNLKLVWTKEQTGLTSGKEMVS